MNTFAAGPILVGFSGGGDSRALLQRALETANGREVIAGIVDHGMRAGSAAEAERARAMAQAAGARAEIKTLTWPEAPTHSQAAARMGRMFALTTLAREVGADAIYLAHTMDDQAETVAMRASRGSGWRGLAGMGAQAPAPLWPAGRGIKLRRPLLNVRRAALRTVLATRAIEWIEDPSNEAEQFARVRVRRALAAWDAAGLGVARWATLAARIAPLASAVDGAARDLIAGAARFSAGTILLAAEPYAAAPSDVRAPALSSLVAAAAGAGGGADWEQLARFDSAILERQAPAGTLGGARYARRGEDILITRDPGAVIGRAGVAPMPGLVLDVDEPVVWDSRVMITAREVGWEAAPGPDGVAPLFLRPRTNGRLTLGEAVSQGVIAAEWLLEERIAHILWR